MTQGVKKFHLTGVVLVLILPFLSVSNIFAQDTNFCEFAEEIEYGDTAEGTVDDDQVFVSFCFTGDEGDEVTITAETTDGDLIPVIGIADPFLEDVMAEDAASNRRDTAEIVFELPDDGDYLILVTREDFNDGTTEGDFELTLESDSSASSDCGTGRGSLGGIGRSCATEEPTEAPQGDDFCEFGEVIEYGDSVRGSINDDDAFDIYCFDGEEGDVVTVTVEATSGDLEPIVLVSDPFLEEILDQDTNSRGRDSVTLEVELTNDGQQLIMVSRVDLSDGDTEGRYTLDLEAESGGGGGSSRAGDTCDDYPLNLLSQYQWGIPGSDPEEPLLAYNVGCTGYMASSIVGRPLVLEYSIDSRGNMEFEVGDTTYTTVSVDENEWVLDTSEGDTLTLERLEDDGCDEAPLADLIRGAWFIEDNEDLVFDYGCNGVMLITFEGDTFAATYEFRRGDITITLEDEDLVFENAEFDNDELLVESDGSALTFVNILDQ